MPNFEQMCFYWCVKQSNISQVVCCFNTEEYCVGAEAFKEYVLGHVGH